LENAEPRRDERRLEKNNDPLEGEIRIAVAGGLQLRCGSRRPV